MTRAVGDAKPSPCTSSTRPILTSSLVTMHSTSRNHRFVGQRQVFFPAQPWRPLRLDAVTPPSLSKRDDLIACICMYNCQFRYRRLLLGLAKVRTPELRVNILRCLAVRTVSHKLHASKNLRPHSCKTLCVTACVQSIGCRPRAICKLWLGGGPTGWPEAPSFCAVKWAV